MTSIVANFTIIGNELCEEFLGTGFLNNGLKTFVVAVAVICLWFKGFYWMRVFEQPAFFMLLIKRTLTDIL